MASLAALGNWQEWHTGYFSEAARLIGGAAFGQWMTIAAMVTNAALLNSTVLTTTRMPFAMAEDRYLPKLLTGLHPRFGTPWLAILASCLVYALLAFQTLTRLITIYVCLRSATTILTVLAVWGMRQRRPELQRRFRVPGSKTGLIYVIAAPVIMSVAALFGSDAFTWRWGPVAILLGPLVYLLLRRARSNARKLTTPA